MLSSAIFVHLLPNLTLCVLQFAKKMKIPYPIKVENGDIVRFSKENIPEVFDKAPYGKIYLDGNIGVEEEAKSIKERKNLSANGFLNVVIIINSRQNTHEPAIINQKGLPIKDLEQFNFIMQEQINKSLKTFSLNNIKQEENIVETLKILCRRHTKEITGNKPLTNINLVRV